MPNWTENHLLITGPDDELRRLRELVNDKEPFCFNKIVPQPDNIDNSDQPNNDNPLWWYNWNRTNWGTKWDAVQSEISIDEPGKLAYVFLTAWAEPEPVIKALVLKFPKLKFIHQFEHEFTNELLTRTFDPIERS